MSSEKSDTKSRILEAARALLEDHAGKGVRMSDIARKAGISRQAVYLHFPARADLLVALTRHMDEMLGLGERLAPSRAAKTGIERLNAYIVFWGEYVPHISGVAQALVSLQDSDAAAAEAWGDRMSAMREGCEAAIATLEREQNLADHWSVEAATDMFCSMMSYPVWKQLTVECGWPAQDYINHMQALARATFVKGQV